MLLAPVASRLIKRFLWLFLVPHIVFAALAIATDAPMLIFWFNAIVVALSAMVCLAFAPDFARIFTEDRPLDRADAIIFGIWISWFSIILQTGLTLLWRLSGSPMWMVNTDYSSYFLWMRVFGVACHVLAPGAIRDRVPPRRWIMIGVAFGAGLLATIVFATMLHADVMSDLMRAEVHIPH